MKEEVLPFELSIDTINAVITDIERYIESNSENCNKDVLNELRPGEDNHKKILGGLAHVLIPLLDGRALLGLDPRVEANGASSLRELNLQNSKLSAVSLHNLSVLVLDGSHYIVSTAGGVYEIKKGLHLN